MPNVKRLQIQLALREWWGHIMQPKVVFIITAVVMILSLAAPFGSDGWGLIGRAAYWGAMVVMTYSIGFITGVLVDLWIPSHNRARHIAVFSLLNGAVITLAVSAVNFALCISCGADIVTHLSVAAQIFAVATGVSVLLSLINDPGPDAGAAPPLLMDRLPPPLRGPIVALSAEDHYTRIRTTKGEELVLVPLRDAIREAAPTEGVQLHRSHWVAVAQIAQVQRAGGKARVILSDGTELPVSRSNAPRLRELGF